MLLKELARDEGEVVKLAGHLFLLLSLANQLVLQLFLVVEEHEFVLEDLRATNFVLLVHILTVSNLVKELLVLMNLQVALLLLLSQVLAHLAQVVGKHLFVCHFVTEVDFLAEANQIN